MNRTQLSAIGLMCGTSHDALDIAHSIFSYDNGVWEFEFRSAKSVDLPSELYDQLQIATSSSAIDLAFLDKSFSGFCVQSINHFLKDYNSPIDLIASHGVTIFHQPEKNLSLQIGSGAIISSGTGLLTVSDFRSQDVAKGGQGAPLVPYADLLLFPDYNATLNLGGFANVALLDGDSTVGFDVCPCNKILNAIYRFQNEGMFDKNGDFARTGSVIRSLYETLNNIEYYAKAHPKSLGHEWFETEFEVYFKDPEKSADTMATVVEHIAFQISNSLPTTGKTLVTGGGAFNKLLIERIIHYSTCEIIVPASSIIEFKEAIEFGLLGSLRLLNMKNISITVTGAKSSSVAGAIYLP